MLEKYVKVLKTFKKKGPWAPKKICAPPPPSRHANFVWGAQGPPKISGGAGALVFKVFYRFL